MTVPSGGEYPSVYGAACDPWDPIYPAGCTLPEGYEVVEGPALNMATEVLYAMTARQFGLCTTTLRPCRRECYSSSWWTGNTLPMFSSTLTPRAAQYWTGMACGSCGTDCSCSSLSEVALPGPIHAVTEVRVDGVMLLPDTDYRLDNNRLLVRLNGEWPTCNDLNLPDTQPGTWSATVVQGQPVPTLGQAALGELAIEFMKLLLCDKGCMLPRPLQSLSRQGVNITFLDPNEMFASGRIGLYLSDLFVQTYNPDGRRHRAKVYNIDALTNNRRLGS